MLALLRGSMEHFGPMVGGAPFVVRSVSQYRAFGCTNFVGCSSCQVRSKVVVVAKSWSDQFANQSFV